jgi:PAS domain S-box-containing protein
MTDREDPRTGGEPRTRRLADRFPAIVYTEAVAADHAGIVYVSPQIRDILGMDPAEWMGSIDRWLSHVHPDDRERVRAENARSDETGEVFATEYRLVAADGRVVWVHDESVLVGDEEGRPLHWQGMILDITEWLRADEQLRAAEALYRTLVEQTPVVTYLEAADASNVTLYISPQVEAMLGYTPDELTTQRPVWHELIHPDDHGWVIAASREADATHEPYDVEYRMIAKDGHVVWIHDQALLICDEEDRPRFWQGVWVDVTERRRAAELERALEAEREEATQLRALDEMKNTFLQAVSHDLRTPLAAILGLAVTLERGDLELTPEDARDLASRIAVNARKLDRMVSDLLDVDRLRRGILEPSVVRVDVGGLVARLVGEWDVLNDRKVEVHADPVLAEVDPAKVERIVENLLANTARHTPSGSHVWVRVRERAQGVLIEVEDDGPGVPPELRSTIFEAFRQGPDAPEHSPGVGIGLALVARFAELHGGHASVEERQGGGACFRVWLPLRPPAP